MDDLAADIALEYMVETLISIQRLKRDSDVMKKGLKVYKLGGDALQRFHRPVPTTCI